jgi:hypothetical protein
MRNPYTHEEAERLKENSDIVVAVGTAQGVMYNTPNSHNPMYDKKIKRLAILLKLTRIIY